ncbi:MAG TPA: FAD-dependent oxidoreductase [Terriglobales bacterium]
MFGQLHFGRMWTRRALKNSYDVVIIGAGVHGLATAYYLAKQGVSNVAVLDKGYLGCGNSGRNTAIIRANYRTLEGIPFYAESLKLYEGLSKTLGYNVMFTQQGHLTLGHTDSAVNGLRVRAAVNQALDVDSRMVGAAEVKRLIPAIDTSSRPRYPIMAALYHPPGGIIRHDAVVWGYAREAARLGVEVHPHTEVLGLSVRDGRIESVETSRGQIQTRTVVNATSGWCSKVARMAGVELPVTSHPLQACVTEPMKPLLNKVIVSANLHVYVSQTPRGEFVLGAEIDPYQSYGLRSTLPTLQSIAAHAMELFPCLARVRILRQWGGVCDMTPDYSPIIGEVPEVKGFYLDVGWGTYGFKAGPVAGKYLARLIASGTPPDLIRPFSLARFYKGNLVGEKAAAAVSH